MVGIKGLSLGSEQEWRGGLQICPGRVAKNE